MTKEGIEKLIDFVLASYDYYLKNSDCLNSERCLVINYEDLCVDLQRSKNLIIDKFGLEGFQWDTNLEVKLNKPVNNELFTEIYLEKINKFEPILSQLGYEQILPCPEYA